MTLLSRPALLAMLLGAALPLSAGAQTMPSNTELLKRIEQLSKQIEMLKQQVKANEQTVARVAAKPAVRPAAAPAASPSEVATLQQQVAEANKKAADAEAAAKKEADALSDVKYDVHDLEQHTLSKWLKIGGDYRFRYDYLGGETEPFVDAMGTFNNAQQALQGDFFANPTGASSYFSGMTTGQALTALSQFSTNMANVRTYSQAQAFVSNPQNQALMQGLQKFADYVPAYKPRISSLYTNRVGINLHAQAAEDVSVTVRLLDYKAFGMQNDNPITNFPNAPFFADRVGVFDGTIGHVPGSSLIDVDRAYADWTNIGDMPIWFSVGRRPSTNGPPSTLRLNLPNPGQGGALGQLVDYTFDGITLGWAPEIDSLPGAFIKLCYGRGYQGSFQNTPGNSVGNTDLLGVFLVPIASDKLRVEMQWDHAFGLFDTAQMQDTYFGNVGPKNQIGDLDQAGIDIETTQSHFGIGDLHLFADFGMSATHPNNNVSSQFGMEGLMTGSFLQPGQKTSRMGWSAYLGARYDLPTRTKLGFEFNHGSKNWITFAPAADDMWTSKVGTRGNVYEAYVIQELPNTPISSYFSKAFFRFGFQYYDFHYTGSNNWVGAPQPISAAANTMQLMTPLKDAYDVYGTFEVQF